MTYTSQDRKSFIPPYSTNAWKNQKIKKMFIFSLRIGKTVIIFMGEDTDMYTPYDWKKLSHVLRRKLKALRPGNVYWQTTVPTISSSFS